MAFSQTDHQNICFVLFPFIALSKNIQTYFCRAQFAVEQQETETANLPAGFVAYFAAAPLIHTQANIEYFAHGRRHFGYLPKTLHQPNEFSMRTTGA